MTWSDYAFQTRRTVNEMRKATEGQFVPHLKISSAYTELEGVTVTVTNVGESAALGVEGKLGFREMKGSMRSWTSVVVESGGKIALSLPLSSVVTAPPISYFRDYQTTRYVRNVLKVRERDPRNSVFVWRGLST
jgi:hypothetical protein